MLLIISVILFILWIVGVVFTNAGYIHTLLLNAVAIFTVHLARCRRCDEPVFKIR